MRKVIIVFISLILCACTHERNSAEYSLWKGSRSYSPEIHKFEAYYTKLKNKRVIYQESFTGNFTLFYSPEKIDSTIVVVPQVHCFSTDLELPKPKQKSNKIKCMYSEQKKYYAKNTEFFFTFETGLEDSDIFTVAFKWYIQFGKNRFIKEITKRDNLYYVISSSVGCALTYKVIKNDSGEYIFKEEDVAICS